jgi:GT2 family glycosyltransferase/2-polyprenyl-3-methyl-5-hydroxy-6-metoxy-1,4-benzoquinol methylase
MFWKEIFTQSDIFSSVAKFGRQNMTSGLFDVEFFRKDCGRDYADADHWSSFFSKIADNIVETFNPKTVLEAGCAFGYLVEALRNKGVEAYGFDISEYAMNNLREGAKSYCFCHSISEPLPEIYDRHYDLIVSIEVVEHLFPEDGIKAISNICNYSDVIIFSSSPDDFDNTTHYNTQQVEYWCREFASHSFFRDFYHKATFICPWAMVFTKRSIFKDVTFEYELNRRIEMHKASSDFDAKINNVNLLTIEKDNLLKVKDNQLEYLRKIKENIELQILYSKRIINEKTIQLEQSNQIRSDKDVIINNLESDLDSIKKALLETQSALINCEEKCIEAKDNETEALGQLVYYKEHYDAAINMREEYRKQLTLYKLLYENISNATFWKMTKPFRVIVNPLKAILRKIPGIRNIYLHLYYLKKSGIKLTFSKTISKFFGSKSNILESNVMVLSENVIKEQVNTVFRINIKFSILVPLYNTPHKYLSEMIESVQAQTYKNWEICLVDGSDKNNRQVEKICNNYAKKDRRLKYRKLEENLGISENTNISLSMSDGDYICLLDHDDLLHPSALYEAMQAICDKNADFIYTDEDKTDANGNYFDPYYKPDFAIDNLRGNNYICHLVIFKKSLLSDDIKFDSSYDGAQDHDIILRLTEKTSNIIHIPKVLYHWRISENSVARDAKAKNYSAEAGIKAVTDHLNRCRLPAVVKSSWAHPNIYRIYYQISGEPLISIIIPNSDHLEDLEKCLKSIIQKTTYLNYEIIIVENNSQTSDIFSYYGNIKGDKIKVITFHGQFNYSLINNFARRSANGVHLLFLNNDVEIISPNWLEEMLMYSQRDDVGAVGAKLYYPDDTLQHGGVILGIGEVAGHSHKNVSRFDTGYMGRLCYSHNLSAVTGACMMLKSSVFDEVGGFDAKFAVAFNDVDLCMRIRKAGYLIVWTPHAEAYHYESKSRGIEDTPEKQIRFSGEISLFKSRYATDLIKGDSYYSPHLTLLREDFSIK